MTDGQKPITPKPEAAQAPKRPPTHRQEDCPPQIDLGQDWKCPFKEDATKRYQGLTNMLGYLYRILIGRFSSCEHVWETQSVCRVVNHDGVSIGQSAYLRCTKCGEWKRRTMV